MSFPSYPKYKDSGVEWLGEVPEHWDVIRLKNVLQRRITDGPHTTPIFLDEGVPFLSVDGIQDGEIQFDGCRFISEADHAEYRKKALPKKDDLLMGKAASTGKIARVKVDFEFSIWSPLALIRFDPSVSNASFFEQSLKSPIAQAQIDNLCTANTQKNISMDDIPRLILTRPPLHEQVLIAAFLDRETAKIDALVAEQRRLMELLKEKRQAVISHAVTQGLNPHAPMKPSGIEWLGDVPAHWDATPIKYVAKVGNGSTPSREVPEYWGETGFPWLNSSLVNSSVVTEAEGFVTERALRECHLPVITPPAILVGITGQGRTRGMAAMLGIEATINQHIAYVKPSTAELDVRYLLRILESAYLKLRRDSEEAGATKGAITCEQIGNLHIPLPPLAEQSAIFAFLNTETTKFNTLTAEAQHAIDLLLERRTALISAAVTGQIDVRQLAQVLKVGAGGTAILSGESSTA